MLHDTDERDAADDGLNLTAECVISYCSFRKLLFWQSSHPPSSERETDSLESASFLGRTDISRSLLLISNCLRLRIQAYRNFVGGAAPSADFQITVLLEELETFLRLCAALVTDSSNVIPPAIISSTPEVQTALLQLIDTCISLGETETSLLMRNATSHPALSSSLSVALLSFFSRFSLTYFGEANEQLTGALRETLLLSAPVSRRFLDVLLRKLAVNLVYYHSEPSVVARVRTHFCCISMQLLVVSCTFY